MQILPRHILTLVEALASSPQVTDLTRKVGGGAVALSRVTPDQATVVVTFPRRPRSLEVVEVSARPESADEILPVTSTLVHTVCMARCEKWCMGTMVHVKQEEVNVGFAHSSCSVSPDAGGRNYALLRELWDTLTH